MISIVIPLFNKEKYVAECIHSVLTQTYKDFELIVVNDGSTDNSLKAVQGFNDSRIIIITIPNSGVSVARNTGIERAKFNWIALLDADDWWDKDFLHEVRLSQVAYPEELIFASGRTRVFKNSKDRYANKLLPNDQETGFVNYYEVIARDFPPLNCSNTIFHKQLFTVSRGFNENMSVHEDHDFWFRICVNNQILFINKPLSFYRKFDSVGERKRRIFPANDFWIYSTTINCILDRVDESNQFFIRKYFSRFSLIALLQNGSYYTAKEIDTIERVICNILNSVNCLMAKVISFVSRMGLYKFYELLRRK